MPSNQKRRRPCGSRFIGAPNRRDCVSEFTTAIAGEPAPTGPRSQRGAVLVLSMVLLVLMGMLGLFAIQASTQQARMASNLLASLQAFEAAENLLATAEARLPATPPSGWQQLGTGRYLIENLGQTHQAAHMPENLPVTLFRLTAIAEERQARITLESVVAWPLSPDHGPARRILWRQHPRES